MIIFVIIFLIALIVIIILGVIDLMDLCSPDDFGKLIIKILDLECSASETHKKQEVFILSQGKSRYLFSYNYNWIY